MEQQQRYQRQKKRKWSCVSAALFFVILAGGSFPRWFLKVASSPVFSEQRSPEQQVRLPSGSLQFSLLIALFPPPPPPHQFALVTLSVLVSLNSQLHLFSLGNPPGSTSFPVRCPGNSIKLLLETTLALTSSISCLSGGVVLYLLTFNFLQTVVLYILLIYFFSFFKFASGKRANSISVTTTPWSEAEISLFLFIADSIPLYSCTTVYLYMY